MKKTALIYLIIVIAIIIIGIMIFGSNKSNNGSINIGVVTPITGDAAPLGEFFKNVTDLAVGEINQNGGIGGRPIALIYEDDQCSPVKTVTATQKLINIDKVKIIIASTCGSSVASMVPVATKAGVFVFTSFAPSSILTNVSPLFARTIPSDVGQGKLLAAMSIDRGFKKIAVVQEISEYTFGIFKAFQTYYTSDKGIIIKNEYPSIETDFRSILAQLKASNPDALFINPQSTGTANRLLKIFSQMSWKVPVIVNDLISGDPALTSTYKSSLEGALAAEQGVDLTNSKYKNLEDNYQIKYGKEMMYKSYGQATYDLVYILSEGLKEYGNNPIKIAEWVRTTKDWDGASGKVTIGSDGDRLGGYVSKVIMEGKVKSISL